MRAVALVLCGVALASAASFSEPEYQSMFSSYMGQYGKKYAADTFFFRYTVFKSNMDKIVLANKQGFSYRLAMNEMGDMTHAEFKAQKLGYNHVDRAHLRAKNACPIGTIKSSEDWTAHNAVTPIKNQGQCGSCWSFSTTGAVEGAVAIASGKLTSLSEQQLIDCSTKYDNQGCNGGLMDNAFEYIIANKGLTTESAYPYSATGPNTCKASGKKLASSITGYCDVQTTDKALEAALSVGPVSVAIEADQSCFQFYSSGVMSDPSCGTQLDHGVLAVGFGTVGGKKYYKVKNSWGASWGDNGYILLGREVSGQTKDGVCGILMAASYPTGAHSL